MKPLPRDFFEQRERYVAPLFREMPTDPQVLFLLAHDVFLREFADLTPEDAAREKGQWFLFFVRRELVLAPDGHPCDDSGYTLGYEIAVYPTDECGYVTNEWAWRYEESATSVEGAVRRLRHRLANDLADKAICHSPLEAQPLEAQPRESPELAQDPSNPLLSLDDTARLVRLIEGADLGTDTE